MIPKIIHYVWLGNNEPNSLAKKCISLWKDKCPDFTVMLWNEENSPISSFTFCREAYEEHKYAYVSDVIRLWALYNYGGIYLDTDLEVLHSLNRFLLNKAFIGFQKDDLLLQTAIMGFEKNDENVFQLLKMYESMHFINNDGTLNLIPNTWSFTKYFENKGLKRNNLEQNVAGVEIYPSDFFCPIDWEYGEKIITENTYAIHHFDGSWMKPSKTKAMARYLGVKRTRQLKSILRKLRLIKEH